MQLLRRPCPGQAGMKASRLPARPPGRSGSRLSGSGVFWLDLPQELERPGRWPGECVTAGFRDCELLSCFLAAGSRLQPPPGAGCCGSGPGVLSNGPAQSGKSPGLITSLSAITHLWDGGVVWGSDRAHLGDPKRCQTQESSCHRVFERYCPAGMVLDRQLKGGDGPDWQR